MRYRNVKACRYQDLRYRTLSPTQAHILLAIVSQAETKRGCWGIYRAWCLPIRTIAHLSKYNERTVKRAIKHLLQINALQVKRGHYDKKKKQRSASTYYLTFDTVTSNEPRFFAKENLHELYEKLRFKKVDLGPPRQAKIQKNGPHEAVSWGPQGTFHGGQRVPNSCSYCPPHTSAFAHNDNQEGTTEEGRKDKTTAQHGGGRA